MNILIRIRYKVKRVFGIIDFLFARLLSTMVRGRGVWLVAEKVNEARDNGYWLYKYLREHHPEQKAYFVISRRSPDYEKIAALGVDRIIKPHSLKHKIFFWAAQYNVCSQPHSNYFSAYIPLRNIREKAQLTVFLQHGVTKDSLSHAEDANVSGMDIFISSARREQQSIIERHGYTPQTCILTGLCRYDNLPLQQIKKSRQILVMPTFRHWIMAANATWATSEEKRDFAADEFCQTYNKLLSSTNLKDLLEQYDYTLVFYPHYCAQPFLDCFKDDERTDRVIVASSKDYDVQKLLIESDVLITDFSSIFFDFAYMKKPEIFFQFDEKRYRAGHYEEGYFKYRRDAFGPVLTTIDEVLESLGGLLEKGCQMDESYKKRVDEFFAYNDQNNCERTYNAIINYTK